MSFNISLIPTESAAPPHFDGGPPFAEDLDSDFFVIEPQDITKASRYSTRVKSNFNFYDIALPSRLQFIAESFTPEAWLLEKVRSKRKELLWIEIDNMRKAFY